MGSEMCIRDRFIRRVGGHEQWGAIHSAEIGDGTLECRDIPHTLQMMKLFLEEFGEWLRHKIRVIVMKQWKRPKTIYRNLSYLNWKHKNGFSNKEIFKVANSRLGWYKRSGMNVVNFIISKDLLENRIKDGAGLLNPLSYYLVKVGI